MLNVKQYDLGINFDKKEFSLDIPRGSIVLGLRLDRGGRKIIRVLAKEDETRTETRRFILATTEEPFEPPGGKPIPRGWSDEFELFEIRQLRTKSSTHAY